MNDKLDPAGYYTSPGLAWNAALKSTKIEWELLNNNDKTDDTARNT